jgi:hypothetical protein
VLSPLSGSTGVLFHITPEENAQSIDTSGILPMYSKGKMQVSWYVRRSEILWALAHTSSRHDLPTNRLVVCAVVIEWEKVKRTSRQGFYYTYERYFVESISPAVMFIEQDK